jgi:abortive infection bacteriophage resistance protein
MIYSKNAITYDQQIAKLEKRGLQIPDREEARHYLRHIGYYRLAGYWWPLQSDKEKHIFKEDASFDRVIELYNFDRELRILLFRVIEKIEISLRTTVSFN